ncbi:MAG: class I SAM-dependent methyltransferase [Patescibacteria group bacterium]
MSDDREIFTGTAHYYAKYRPGYPPDFFDFVIKLFHLNGYSKLLDLGCGTGQLTIPLAPQFQEAIGLDPEKEMLTEAKKLADSMAINNINWVESTAENFPFGQNVFKLTTMGASFHWMRQDEILNQIYEHTEVGGGLVITSNPTSAWKNDYEEKWQATRRGIVQKYLGQERRAGDSIYVRPKDRFEDIIDRSPFGRHEEWTHEYEQSWTLDSVIGYLYSTSFAARRLFGDQIDDFEQELKTELLRLEPNGIFKEQVRLTALIATK